MLLKRLLVIVSVSFFVGCQSYKKQKDSSQDMLIIEEEDVMKEETIVINDSSSKNKLMHEKKDSLDPKEVLSFLTKFQKVFQENDFNKIADFVEYPLDEKDESCIHIKVFGYEKMVNNGEKYEGSINKEVFIQKIDSIYSPITRSLISKVDFEKLIYDKTYTDSIQVSKDTKFEIYLYFREDYFQISISYIDSYESINEYALHFNFKKSELGEFILFSINCVG